MSDSTPKDNMPGTPQSGNISDLTLTPQSDNLSDLTPKECNLQDYTSSVLATPKKRPSSSLPGYPTPTKMYSPVPKQVTSEEAPAPICLKEKTRAVEEHVKLAASEIDTLLKSTLYSISKNESSDAERELEKIRRLNRSHEKKTSFLISDLNKEINNHDLLRRTSFFDSLAAQSKVEKLQKETNAEKEKIKHLQKTIQELVGYDDSTEFEVPGTKTDANIP